MYFFQDHKWKVRSGPKKKVPSRKSQAPVFRKQELKLASSSGSSEILRSSQAFEPTNAGLKPTSQGFKPQALKFQFQDSGTRVQAHKLRIRGPGNEDK
jgi:hypothetical protein